MDASEPSTNGTSAANLYRLSTMLEDEEYKRLSQRTVEAFESEILQYPWLFGSFMPSVVATRLGTKSVVVAGKSDAVDSKLGELRMSARGGLDTVVKVGQNTAWIRTRNPRLKDFKVLKGEGRIMVCEGAVCREEGDVNDTALGEALPK
jgi:uncharacterized protein YyaL (SSP411 family)